MARILITGSNSGFGRLTVLTLARDGHHVIATMRDVTKGDALRADCSAEGLEIEVRQLDVCDPASISAAFADAADLDVLVNNAGFEIQGALDMIDDDLMHRQLDTNVVGPLRTIRAVLPAWRTRGSGAIVNVGSIAGRAATPWGGAYSASKFALEGMSEALHFEVSGTGIRVHVIEPGRFPTEFADNIVRPAVWAGSDEEARAAKFRQALTALDSAGPQDPQTVADAIARAAVDPATPFRTLVGADAELIDAAKSAMSFEEFDATMRATLNWYE